MDMHIYIQYIYYKYRYKYSNSVDLEAQSVEDWRSFRARLLQREDTLTADLPETVSEASGSWIHQLPSLGSITVYKPGAG